MAKIGEGHAEAMLRLGLHELQGAVYPDSNVAQRAEVGVFGSPTQSEIMQERRDEGPEVEPPRSILAETLQRAESRIDRPSPEREPERG